MRILFLTQVLPLPLDAGPKARAYYVLRHLAERGHDVTLVSFVRPGDERHVGELTRMCRRVEMVPIQRSLRRDLIDGVRSLLSAEPFLVLRDRLRPMDERITRILDAESFDALHADQLWMASYLAGRNGPAVKVLDQHNAVFLVPERLAANHRNPIVRRLIGKEAAKLARYERQVCERFDHVVWVSAEDRSAVAALGGHGRDRDPVIPIATDPSATAVIERPDPFRVTFVGGMHWPPNAEGVSWFAEQAWPAVATAVPQAVLTLIGRGAPRRLGPSALASRVEVTGYVADLTRHLSETAVFIVPLRTGAGMRVKILDAWCWGLPIVSTTVGAEGILVTDGENILIGNDGSALAEGVVRVFRDRSLSERLAGNGRATVEALYDWRKVYRAWDQIYH